MRVEHIYISPGHNFFGHRIPVPGKYPFAEIKEAQCVANRGIVGDRFYDYKRDYKGQVTFFSLEVYADLCRTLGVSGKSPDVFRRNVIVSGVDLNTLIGQRFSLQEIEFQGVEECRPCAWMDHAFASGAHALLEGRGGLRARILSDGVLTTP